MRVLIMGAAVAGALMTPAFADYYIVQQPETRRCTIVEERPASPSVGVVIGGSGFAVRTEAESRLRTVEECRTGTTGSGSETIIEERRVRTPD